MALAGNSAICRVAAAVAPAEAVICQMPAGTAELRGTVHVNGIAALSVLNWSLSGLRSTSRRATVGNIRLISEVDRQ